ncbi:MAG: WbuC family cupin fold metalloprotein [Candidatus Cryptobacteroides sp.]
MIAIDKTLISGLLEKAALNPRLRQNYDLRSSETDGSQRMLNALQPGTVVPVHRHPRSNESIVLLCGKAVELFYDAEGRETQRFLMDPDSGTFGCVVPAGAWHSIEALEPTVIMEVKDGRYGEDGSESR